MTSQHEKAERFLKLHQEGESLLLPNAWDVVSARVFEDVGFPAIATTSAGVAFANGYIDGQQISRDEMLEIIARIVAAVQVPVTADIEAGYGSAPEDVAATIRGVIEAGAVGVNLEDNTGIGQPLFSREAQTERIAAARQEAKNADLSLVINARIDTYLYRVGEESTRLEDTLQRARDYLQAGADSNFVPGTVEPALSQGLVSESPPPPNIMAGPGAPSAPELFSLGVRRVSVGAAPMLAVMGLIREIGRELREQGTYEQIAQHPYPYAEAKKLFTKNPGQ